MNRTDYLAIGVFSQINIRCCDVLYLKLIIAFETMNTFRGSHAGKIHLSSCPREMSSVPFDVTLFLRRAQEQVRTDTNLCLLTASLGVLIIHEGTVIPAEVQSTTVPVMLT